MPWRRRYTISKGCYYADVCANTGANNDDDDDDDDDDDADDDDNGGGGDNDRLFLVTRRTLK